VGVGVGGTEAAAFVRGRIQEFLLYCIYCVVAICGIVGFNKGMAIGASHHGDVSHTNTTPAVYVSMMIRGRVISDTSVFFSSVTRFNPGLQIRIELSSM